MHWGTEPFAELYEALNASALDGRPDARAAPLLAAVRDDVRELLATPPPAAASREALTAQRLVLPDGAELRLSAEFVGAAAQLADELRLDEGAAAQLVYYAAGDAARLDVTLLQAALALFYVRRRYILNILLFLVDQANESTAAAAAAFAATGGAGAGDAAAAADTAKSWGALRDSVLADKPAAAVLAALQAVERGLADADEKVKRSQALGFASDPAFVQITRMQREFLAAEHQTLAAALSGLVRAGRMPVADVRTALDHVATFASYNDYVWNYLAPLALAFRPFAGDLELGADGAGCSGADTEADAAALYSYFADDGARHRWTMSWWRSLLGTTFLVFYAGTRAAQSGAAYADTRTLLRREIDAGGLEALMAIAQDANPAAGAIAVTHETSFGPLVRRRVPVFAPLRAGASPVVAYLLPALESLFESFVTHLADILQEMRLNEEDTYLSLSLSAPATTAAAAQVVPGKDLERFFLFIAYLFESREAAATLVWADPSSSVYGFLVWASQSQVALMSATFARMLAALSSSPVGAEHAHRFLLEAPGVQTLSAAKSPFIVSWASIRELLHYYVKKIEPGLQHNGSSGVAIAGSSAGAASAGHGPTADGANDWEATINSNGPGKAGAAYNAAPPHARAHNKPTPLDEEALLTVHAYLGLVAQVARYSDKARSQAWQPAPDGQLSLIGVLFHFLRFQTSVSAPVLGALASFAPNDGDHPRNAQLWRLLDQWAFEEDIVAPDGTIIYSAGNGRPRFAQLLASAADALGLVALLAALFTHLPPHAVPSSRHLESYARFVVREVLPVTADKAAFTARDVPLLQHSCLSVLHTLLTPLGGLLSPLRQRDVDLDAAVEGGTLAEYIARFPFEQVRKWCFEAKVYNTLFALVRTGVDVLDQLPAGSPALLNTEAAVEIIGTLLADVPRPGSRFDQPLLFNLAVIPYLFFFAGGVHVGLARGSVRLLALLGQSTVFAAAPSRRSRILSILESVQEAPAIKFGLMRQLERDNDAVDDHDADALFSLKMELLQYLAEDLARGRSQPGPLVAHYLLGFRIHGDGTLVVDADASSGVGSGASTLDTVLALLKLTQVAASPSAVSKRAASLLDVTTRILLGLVQHPLSSRLTLDYLRSQRYLLDMLRNETIVSGSTVWEDERFAGGFRSAAASEAFVRFFSHRAAFMEILSLEVHTVATGQLLSLHAEYADLLVNLQHDASRSVLTLLDFMKFGVRASAPASELPALPSPGSAYRESGKSAVTAAADAKEGSAALKAAELACLRAWCQLVPVIVNDPPYADAAGSEAAAMTFVLETIQTLVPRLGDYARADSEVAAPLASLLVLLLERYQASAIDGVAAAARLHSLFQAALLSVPAAASAPELRRDLYVITYQVLNLARGTANPALLSDKLQLVVAGGDRLLQTIAHDALTAAGVRLRVSALLLLQGLAASAKTSSPSFVQEGLVRYNVLPALVEAMQALDAEITTSHTARWYGVSVVKITLSLFLQLARDRRGADAILRSSLLTYLQDSTLLQREDLLKKSPDVLLAVFQLLVAIALAMGPENVKAGAAITRFLARYEPLALTVLRADAAGRGLATESVLAQLADAVTILFELTGYVPSKKIL